MFLINNIKSIKLTQTLSICRLKLIYFLEIGVKINCILKVSGINKKILLNTFIVRRMNKQNKMMITHRLLMHNCHHRFRT